MTSEPWHFTQPAWLPEAFNFAMVTFKSFNINYPSLCLSELFCNLEVLDSACLGSNPVSTLGSCVTLDKLLQLTDTIALSVIKKKKDNTETYLMGCFEE